MSKTIQFLVALFLIIPLVGNGGFIKSNVASRQSIVSQHNEKPYDARVEYLESVGDAWIVTPILFAQGILEIELYAISTFDGNPNNFRRSIVGSSLSARLNDDGIDIAFYWVNTWAFRYRTWGNIQGAMSSFSNMRAYMRLDTYDGTIYREIGNFKGSVVDDRLRQIASGNNIVLFASGRDGEGCYPAKLYSIMIWIDGELVLDGIPVRVGNMGYLYDRVSSAFLMNAGTGNFIIGPDL